MYKVDKENIYLKKEIKTMTKMTKRQDYTTLLEMLHNEDIVQMNETTEAIIGVLEAEIASLDKKTAKAKERRDAKVGEDTVSPVILEVLDENESKGLAEVVAEVNEKMGEEITTQKVTQRLAKLAKAGQIVKEVLTLENKRKRTVYRRV